MNGNSEDTATNGTGDSENQEPAMKRRRTNGSVRDIPPLSSELDLYDKHHQCLVEAGEYEILMRELTSEGKIQTKNATWESINGDKKDSVSLKTSSFLQSCQRKLNLIYFSACSSPISRI